MSSSWLKPSWPAALRRRRSTVQHSPASPAIASGETPPASTLGGTLPASTLNGSGVRTLPRPALRWVGPAGRIALRPFDLLADSEAVCAFQQETYEANFPDFHYTAHFADAFRFDLRRAALDSNHALFVLDDGQIIGFLWIVICENTWTRERFGYTNNLFVAANRRGLGLGRELMAQGERFLRSRNVKTSRLTVTAANATATRLYQNCGYDVTRWEMEKTL